MTTSIEVRATGAAADAISAHVAQLVGDQVASKLFAKDYTLWGQAAEEESSKRLSWVGLAESSRPLVERIEALHEKFTAAGMTHVVLCGMGGSSLAPEVICATAGKDITVLDSSQPDMVRAAVADRLSQTVVVVSSKSGSTVETDSQRRAYEKAFQDAGEDPAKHIVVVTDPGSPLEKEANDAGYEVVNADPGVGGRYSALTAFGLVPSGLAGVDISALLDDAEAATEMLNVDDESNPALRLGAVLGGTSPLRDKIVLVDAGTDNVGFGDWAEQLIAESTGKDGKGLLPVVVGTDEPRPQQNDETIVRLVSDDDDADLSGDSVAAVSGPLGAQMLLWEAAVAVAGRLIGINPFDQPDVESAKAAARDLLGKGTGSVDAPAFTDGAVEVRAVGGPDNWLGDASTAEAAIRALLAQLPQHGYLAIMAYLDRVSDAPLAGIRSEFADKLQRPVTFGWGPRFLHSTGQYHKGGPATGVYLQITTAAREDLAVPGRDFTFGDFISAQAGGDAGVLAKHGRPVLRLNLTDHDAGLAAVKSAVEKITRDTAA